MCHVRVAAVLLALPALACSHAAFAFENEDCLLCHGDADNWDLEDPGAARLYLPETAFAGSIHGELACDACHSDIEELPHGENLAGVDCGACHPKEEAVYADSLHGRAVAADDPLAPHCWDCHGSHDILALADPRSRTNPINIPEMCGACHAEDAPVARARDIDQHRILEHYVESIHGEGLKRKGLTVTAVCTSCHTAHRVLPHTDERSTIHRDNVVGTCMQCHGLIEEVHRKVIEGRLWEEEPDKIPVCIDCHQPHEARKVYYDEGVSDRDCMACHAEPVQGATRELAAVETARLAASTHAKVRCAQCHTGADPARMRPCATVVARVDCAICHADQVDQHRDSLHGRLALQGDPDAPVCLDCHSDHGTQSKTDPTSPTFPKNVPALCGRCHREGEKAAVRRAPGEEDVVAHYAMSIHGKGLLQSGLVVTAMCSDCHTAHHVLPPDDPRSSVHPAKISGTCGRCHHGIEQTFDASIHSASVSRSDQPLPVCSGCHTAHSIRRTDVQEFKLDVMQTCGRCHEEVAETYFDTYHGKVTRLGSAGAAKCHDCHGAHDVLPVSDPRSHLSRDNVVATCAKCHPGSHRRFAGYLTHATHHDPVKYPILFWTFWAMTALLIGTFGFFGLHTLAWLPRSFAEMRRHRAARAAPGERMFKRFPAVVRQLHFVLILSFFGLALTGMTLKFSYTGWAQTLSVWLGGFDTAGSIHRVCAVIMFIVFVIHLGYIVHRKRETGARWLDLFTGSRTLVPTLHDARELFQSLRWFLRLGPRPAYGEWTYWEKFDYFAVFWGVAIIGSTGLILWFPELFTYVLPGWIVNVATIVHSDEALLAVGFIFTIHFFNTHFRPEKFPMDLVMFTGRVPLEEFKRERPRHYEELLASGELEERLAPPEPKELRFWSVIFGTLALVTGFTLVLFIVWEMLFGYR